MFLLSQAQISAPIWFLNLQVLLRSAQAEPGNTSQTHNSTILRSASTETETDDFNAFASSENEFAGSHYCGVAYLKTIICKNSCCEAKSLWQLL